MTTPMRAAARRRRLLLAAGLAVLLVAAAAITPSASPDGYANCSATVIIEPDPDRPALGMELLTSPDCDALRTAAELMVPRLPLAPR